MCPYVAEVFLVHLDLFDFRSVIGGVDFVLLFVVILPIQTLRKRKKYERCFFVNASDDKQEAAGEQLILHHC